MKPSRLVYFFYFPLFSVIITTLFGCRFLSTDLRASIQLPELTYWNNLDQANHQLRWELSWMNGDGSLSTRHVSSKASIMISLPKEHPVVVCAVPIVSKLPSSFRFRPAGYLDSAHKPAGTKLSLSWEDGFSAFFMLELARSGVYPGVINIRKFKDAIAKRGGENPWRLNSRHLKSNFANGDLWIYSFRRHPVHSVHLSLAEGSWYSDYPPEPPMRSTTEGWKGELSEGLHQFIRDSGIASATVSINKRGEATLLVEN